jgi:hypothetical protein
MLVVLRICVEELHVAQRKEEERSHNKVHQTMCVAYAQARRGIHGVAKHSVDHGKRARSRGLRSPLSLCLGHGIGCGLHDRAAGAMGKTRSGKRDMNPTDAYRKEQRKKELKKNKKDRKRVRELGSYVKNPDLLKAEVRDLRRGTMVRRS